MTPDWYVTQIRQLATRRDLLAFWESNYDKPVAPWGSGKPFEYLVIRAFELEGAAVEYPFEVPFPGDGENNDTFEQIDGAVYTESFFCLVESKAWEKTIDVKPIAKLRHQLLRRPWGTTGLIFSQSGFTPAAKRLCEFALPQTILLWSGEDLRFGLENGKMIQGLTAKFRYAITHGYTDLPLKEALS